MSSSKPEHQTAKRGCKKFPVWNLSTRCWAGSPLNGQRHNRAGLWLLEQAESPTVIKAAHEINQIFTQRQKDTRVMVTQPLGLLHGNALCVKPVHTPQDGRRRDVHRSTTDGTCQLIHLTSGNFNNSRSLEKLPNPVQNYQFFNDHIPLNISFIPEVIFFLANA